VRQDGGKTCPWARIAQHLFTQKGVDWRARYPAIVTAVAKLKVRSCLLDGEVIVADDYTGVARFDLLRSRRHDTAALLCDD
jgi:ATP-dependent DNA ligase